MLRRDVLTGLMALAATPAFAQGKSGPGLQVGDATPFVPSQIANVGWKGGWRSHSELLPRSRAFPLARGFHTAAASYSGFGVVGIGASTRLRQAAMAS